MFYARVKSKTGERDEENWAGRENDDRRPPDCLQSSAGPAGPLRFQISGVVVSHDRSYVLENHVDNSRAVRLTKYKSISTLMSVRVQ